MKPFREPTIFEEHLCRKPGENEIQTRFLTATSYEWLVELIEPWPTRSSWPTPPRCTRSPTARRRPTATRPRCWPRIWPRGRCPGPPADPAATRAPHAGPPRQYLKQCATALKVKIRRIASDYNADRKDRSPPRGWEGLGKSSSADSDRFVLAHCTPRGGTSRGSCWTWPAAQGLRRGRARRGGRGAGKLRTAPFRAGEIDVVVSELGDVGRFHSAKAVCAYAGRVPGCGRPRTGGRTYRHQGGLAAAAVGAGEARGGAVLQGAAWRRVYQTSRSEPGAKGDRGGGATAAVRALAMLRDGTVQLPEGREPQTVLTTGPNTTA